MTERESSKTEAPSKAGRRTKTVQGMTWREWLKAYVRELDWAEWCRDQRNAGRHAPDGDPTWYGRQMRAAALECQVITNILQNWK